MRSLFCSLLVLLLALPVLAGTWTHSGSTWKHKNGLSITLPEGFWAEEGESGILQVTGKHGFVSLIVQGLNDEKEMKSWVKAEQMTLDAEGLAPQNERTTQLKSGLLAHTFEAERVSEQGILFVIVSAALQSGKKAMGIHMFYPREREEAWTPLFVSIFNSVK